MQRSFEFIRRNSGLLENAGKRSKLEFAMKRDYATCNTGSQDDVASTLPHHDETELPQCANGFGPGNPRQVRNHDPLRRTS
jgi:hypothetical protein